MSCTFVILCTLIGIGGAAFMGYIRYTVHSTHIFWEEFHMLGGSIVIIILIIEMIIGCCRQDH